MRQIFPLDGDQAGPLLGPADPLDAAARIRPPAASAEIDQLVRALGAIYAYPEGPWLRANMVTSVDGAVTVDGRSGGLSGAADKLVFSVLRSLADVVLAGAGTVRAERYRQAQADELWPQLRAGRPLPPIAVVTSRLDLDLGDRLFGPDGPRTIVLTTERANAAKRAEAARVADVVVAGPASVTATAAVTELRDRGFRRILVEGGPSLLGQLAAEGLLDELCLTTSPLLEGGHAAGRILASHDPAGRPAGLRLASLLEDGGALLARYVRA
ncbi:MAG TPA: dihydrofolate reductase family protein [Streptosporangiaceae bacterium]